MASDYDRVDADGKADAIAAALLTPSADLPACRDEDPAHAATLTAAYPDLPEYQHPEDDHG